MPKTQPQDAETEFLDGAWERAASNVAERITKSQYKAAKEVYLQAKSNHYSDELAIEKICCLMAQSFRAGINITLETYGLKPPAPPQEIKTVSVPVYAVGDKLQ